MLTVLSALEWVDAWLPKMGLSQSHGVVYGKTVDTKSGPIRGRIYTIDKSEKEQREVDAYLGVPYAEPPIGELRFKKPVPTQNWAEVVDCVHFGPRCPQTDEYCSGILNIVGKDEAKCLTLNIFTPSWKSDKYPDGFPIMVWIHGGGFVMHSSSNYGDKTIARNLCSKDVMVVSINYRLGIFGFFCNGEECKGNQGLWDMTLALKWVKDNAETFGGNPNNITLFGQSAGGASVDLLSLSPHSRELFHKVIPMAGCGECDFAIRSAEEQTELSFGYAKYLGWKPDEEDSDDPTALYEFVKKQSPIVLEIGISGKKGFGYPGQLYFTPNMDGDFFPKPLCELRDEAPRKPVMTGVTQNEGLFFLSGWGLILWPTDYLMYMGEFYSENIVPTVGLSPFSRTHEGMKNFISKIIRDEDFDDAEAIRNEMLDFYMKGVSLKNKQEIVRRFVKLIGDFAINVGTYEYARKQVQLGSDVYLYTFNYCNPNGFGIVKWILPFLGATHCSELRYVLGKGVISKFRPNEDDKKMIEIMTTFFTNFAKFGNPNGESGTESANAGVWEKMDASAPYRHLNISLKPTMAEDYCEKRPDFWRKIRESNLTRANL